MCIYFSDVGLISGIQITNIIYYQHSVFVEWTQNCSFDEPCSEWTRRWEAAKVVTHENKSLLLASSWGNEVEKSCERETGNFINSQVRDASLKNSFPRLELAIKMEMKMQR